MSARISYILSRLVALQDLPPAGRAKGVIAVEITAEMRAIRTGVLPSFYLSFTFDKFQA